MYKINVAVFRVLKDDLNQDNYLVIKILPENIASKENALAYLQANYPETIDANLELLSIGKDDIFSRVPCYTQIPLDRAEIERYLQIIIALIRIPDVTGILNSIFADIAEAGAKIGCNNLTEEGTAILSYTKEGAKFYEASNAGDVRVFYCQKCKKKEKFRYWINSGMGCMGFKCLKCGWEFDTYP